MINNVVGADLAAGMIVPIRFVGPGGVPLAGPSAVPSGPAPVVP